MNLFEIDFVSPATDGVPSADIPLGLALDTIETLVYDTSDYSLVNNRYHYRPDRRARYGLATRQQNGLYFGIISRNDLDGGQTEVAGVVTDLALGSNVGIHHASHFVLDPIRRRVLLESNGFGPRAGDLAGYLQSRLGSHLPSGVERCTLKPVIDIDAITRFEREMGSLAGVEVAVLRPNIDQLMAATGLGAGSEVASVRNSMQAIAATSRTIEVVSFSMQRKPYARSGGLGARWKRAVGWLARNRSADLYKLKASVENARDDSGSTEIMNLLSERTGHLIDGIATRTNRNIIVSDAMHAHMMAAYAEM